MSSPSEIDHAMALRLQAEEDSYMAMKLEDERIAQTHDPWHQASLEWDQVMREHDVRANEKMVDKIRRGDEHQHAKKKQIEAEDARLAAKIAQFGTPVKAAKVGA